MLYFANTNIIQNDGLDINIAYKNTYFYYLV